MFRHSGVSSTARWRRLVNLAAFLLVALAAAIAFSSSKAKFDGDEAEWIGTSKYFYTLFIERDVSPTGWEDSYWTRTQPMVARYAIGSWLWVRGYDLPSFEPYYDHNANREANLKRGLGPSDDLLTEARRPQRLLAALAVLALYTAVATIAGVPGGLVAALLAIGSPYLREHLIRAKGDTALMLFTVCGLLATILSLQRGGRRSALGWAAGLAGVSLGLALGSKLTAILGFGAVALGGGFVVLRAIFSTPRGQRLLSEDIRRALGTIAIILAVATATFIASDPYLYPDPVGRTWTLFANRQEEMAGQMATEPYKAMTTWQQRTQQVWERSLFHETWGASYVGVPVEAYLALLGLGWLILRGPVHGRAPETMLLAWVVCFAAGVSWGLGYRQQHYFIPTTMMGLVLAGLGAGWIWDTARRAITHRSPASHAAQPSTAR
ncbi:MAG: glycosyltransferase family 39 protein [Chloroflexota bacterium]